MCVSVEVICGGGTGMIILNKIFTNDDHYL